MKITYGIVTESISYPDLGPEQNQELREQLSSSLINEPVRR